MNNSIIQDANVSEVWDCIVIGAGPAGAMAALQIAKTKSTVLLIDKAEFPRTKVCGCCINKLAAAALEVAGLGDLLHENGANVLSALSVFDGARRANISLPKSFSLSRIKLDMALIKAAIDCGVQFLPRSLAKVLSLGDLPCVQVGSDRSMYTLQAKIVIVADGLAGNSLELLNQFKPKVKHNSKFGASVILEQAPEYVEDGRIYMACGSGGYVGMVKLEDGRLNVATALDHKLSKQFRGPSAAAHHLLQYCGLAAPIELLHTHWTGTDLLTRVRPAITGRRLFVAGDACGYTEPFTGEGMAWALWSGLAVADLVIAGIQKWDDSLEIQWRQAYNELIMRKLPSELIATLLRSDLIRTLLIDFSVDFPLIANWLARRVTDRRINSDRGIFVRG